MKTTVIGRMAVAMAALMLGANVASASIATTGIDANVSASSTDLLQTHLASAVLGGSWNDSAAPGYGANLLDNATPLYNGVALVGSGYDYSSSAPSSEWLICSWGTSQVTFTLDTSGANSLGYEITQIDFFHGWPDDGRDGMQFRIQYSTVSDPGTFLDYGISTKYDPPSNYGISRITDSTGTIATGVAALRFSMTDIDNMWGGISEIDVIGTIPEPSAALLGAIGLLCLLRRQRN